MRTISSNLTFPVKVALPIAWVAGMAAITLGSWLGFIHTSDGAPLPPELNWLFLAMWGVGTPLVLWVGALLKKVRMDSLYLYISNFRKEIVVPFTNVARVTENPQNGVHPVTVYFRTRTAFGRKITFLTTFRLSTWSPHSVSAEIKTLAGIADR